MTKDNLTIGHYASHKNTGGYQPPKSDRPKTINPPKCGGVESFPEQMSAQPSDIEFRIRKEVHKNIEILMDELYNNGLYNREYPIELLTKVRDRLNLLWGSNENM